MGVTDQTWRQARAAALDATAEAVDDCLAHIANVGEALAEREDVGTAGRTYAGHLRTVRNDLMNEARTLRAGVEA